MDLVLWSLPEDIDLVHDLRYACGLNQYRAYRIFQQREAIKARYGVDYLVNLPDNNDFSAYFQYVGTKVAAATGLNEKHPRGILSIWSTSWRNGLTK